jgi:hypothetical protein
VARAALARCLAVGLTAACAGRCQWEGAFPIGAAIDRAAWDVLSHAGSEAAGEAAGRPVTPTRDVAGADVGGRPANGP